MVEEIQLYEAIRQMRELTKLGKTFSFVHSTYDRDRVSTSGIRQVMHAKLRPAPDDEEVANADFKLFYFDEDIMEPRNCWQHLIMWFNDKKIFI